MAYSYKYQFGARNIDQDGNAKVGYVRTGKRNNGGYKVACCWRVNVEVVLMMMTYG